MGGFGSSTNRLRYFALALFPLVFYNAGMTVDFYTVVAVILGVAGLHDFLRSEVTNIVSAANGAPVEAFAYSYDALGRPVARNADTFGYNDRSEVTNNVALLSRKATEKYDWIVFGGDGSESFGDKKSIVINFSDGIFDQRLALKTIKANMTKANGNQLLVSCFQSWKGGGAKDMFKERLILYPPRYYHDDKAKILSFQTMSAGKVVGK